MQNTTFKSFTQPEDLLQEPSWLEIIQAGGGLCKYEIIMNDPLLIQILNDSNTNLKDLLTAIGFEDFEFSD